MLKYSKSDLYPFRLDCMAIQQKSSVDRSILLLNPPWEKKKGNIWKSVASCLPSLGLGILAAYLEQSGIKATIIDYQAEDFREQEFCQRLEQIQPIFVGITATSVLIKNALDLARVVKQTSTALVVIGGVHATIMPEEVLSNLNVDYVIRGEGEKPLLSLVRGNDPNTIDGISFKKDGHLVHVGPQVCINNLDKLPYPAYHLLPIKLYHTALGSARREPSLSLLTTRGCPGRCTFCNSQVFGKHLRFRSAEHILGEIDLLTSNYGIREVSFYDDTFCASKTRVVELCRLLIDRHIDLTWTCMSRVDYADPEVLSVMARAGCHLICYGVESADPTILATIKKNINLEQVRKAVRMTQETGIEVRLSFMIGNPGETRETIEKTIQFAIDVDPDMVQFNITTPYPGSEMYKWAKENNYLLTEDWSLYDYYHYVMELPTISSREIEHAYKEAYRRFFFRPAYLMKRLKKLRSFRDLRMAFRGVQAIFATGHRS